MAKRFVDSKIWDKKWFRKLAPEMKCAWFYLINRCDAAGIWEVDEELMSVFIGQKIELQTLIKSFDGKLEVVGQDKIWLVDFCDFQYGELKENYNPHVPVIKSLKKYNLISRVGQGLVKTSPSLIDKDKDKDKDKGKERIRSKNSKFESSLSAFKTKFPNAVRGAHAIERFEKQIKSEIEFQDLMNSIQNYHDALEVQPWRPSKTSFATYLGTEKSGYFWRDFINFKPTLEKNSDAAEERRILERLESLE